MGDVGTPQVRQRSQTQRFKALFNPICRTLHMHIWACWKNLIFPNHEFVKGHYVKLYCFVEGKKRSSEISGHQVVTRWSQSGHQVVTRWVLGGQQVVVKTWIFNSFLIPKYVLGSKMILKHSNKNTIYENAWWTFDFPSPAPRLFPNTLSVSKTYW